MFNHKNESFCKVQSKVQEKKKYKHENIKMHFGIEMEEFVNDSQNFCLKLSQDSTISDTQDAVTNDEKDIIIISDSSSTCSSPKSSSESRFKLNRHFTPKNEVFILDSSNSNSSDTQEENFFQAWKANKKYNFISHSQKRKNIVNKNHALLTSDDTSSSSSEQNKRFIQSSDKTSSTYISVTPDNNTKIVQKTSTQFHSNALNEKSLISSCIGSSSSSKSSKSMDQPVKVLSANNKNHSDCKKKLTRKNARDIMKNIKSTKLVYESPRRENNTIIDESIDNGIHPAISPKDNLKSNIVIIDETPGNSGSDVPSSQINVTSFHKNHVSRFLKAPHVDKDEGAMCMDLSDRKKKQISQWLMTNSPDSKSDSSFSIVPASNKGDISSGNSSLERLEMNYETPNNRGKIYHAPTSEKRITDQDCNKIIETAVSRQTTLHDFIQQSQSNGLELCTPKNNCTKNTFSNPTKDKSQSVTVMDCADILDKLYGKSWREKAEVLFPKSEPRKQAIPTRNRAVQTERKAIKKGKVYTTDSDDDGSNTSFQDFKSQKSSTKKNVRRNTKQKDSSINDVTSSESGCESLYVTALTNPRISSNSVKHKPPLPRSVQRALAICDTDTESEDDKGNINEIRDLRRKLFSNDESEHSSTSEFDPGDDVPPKPTARKDPIKTSRQISKISTVIKPTDNQKYEKRNSFLASLSENVPVVNAHPDAKKYRMDYKNNKENLCNYLYKLYNEKVFDKKLPEDMSIEWNIRMRGTAGFCYNKKSLRTLGGIVRTSRIVLATKILDTPDRLRDTLIHEMCHAAAWLINDVSDGHGPFWTGWANKAMKTFPELPPIRRCHDYKIKTKFTYKCVGCGYSIGRHSKSLDVERKRCGHCYGKFELLLNKTTKSGTVQVQTPKREPTGFALYVKENYSTVKKERNIRHAEVMKILGQQFSAVKIAKKQANFENDPDTPG